MPIYKTLVFTLFSFLFLFSFSGKSLAYFDVFGLKIPSNLTELKQVFNKKALNEKEETKNVLNNQEQSQETAVVYTDKDGEEEITRTDNIVYDSAKGPTHEVKIIAKGLIDELAKKAIGKSYFGYTIENAKVDLFVNRAKIYVWLNNEKSLELEVELIENGTKLGIINLVSTGNKALSSAEMFVVKQAVTKAPDLLVKYFGEYKNRFRFATIAPGKVEFWLIAENYME